MNSDDAIREHLLNALRGTTERRFDETVRDFPPQFMNVKPPHVDYTPWHLLEHLRGSQRDLLDYIRDPNYVAPHWPDDYWPAKESTADGATWAVSVEQFRADRKALEALLTDPATDLVAPLAHTPGHTVLREILLDIGHTAFHLGEFGILRQVMQSWPPGHQ
jgi:hypothetical protein